MSNGLHLLPRHRAKLEALLRAHLPDVEVWAYGSRVTGESHDGSDLDLVLRGPNCEEIDIGRLGDFTEAVDMSTIPFIVEARDWARLPESFHESILQSYMVLVGADSHSPSRSSPALAGDHHETVAQRLADTVSRTGSRLRIREWAPFSYGKGLPKHKRAATGNIRVYGSNGVVGYHDTPLTNGPTIIIGRKGTVGAVHYSSDPCWPIDTTFFIEGDDPVLHRFKYYALKAADLHNMNADSAVPGLNRNEAHAKSIYVPPVAEQRSIACILGALDDKIELNRRMSETLDEMARALFRSWFVDFDPVHAKAQGQPTGLPDRIDALFPDSFEPSELGDIPTGWRTGELGDVVEQIRDNMNPFDHPDVLFQHYSIPAYDISKDPVETLGRNIRSAKSRVESGSVLLSKLNPEIARVWLVDVVQEDRAICSTEFMVLVPREPFGRHYVYCLALSTPFRSQIESLVTGTSRSHQRAPAAAILALPLVRPPASVVAAFGQLVAESMATTLQCRKEAKVLSTLRDTLLPKLLSGELRVPAAAAL